MSLIKSASILALSSALLLSAPITQVQAGKAGKILGGLAAGAAAGYVAHKVYKHHKRKKTRTYTKRYRPRSIARRSQADVDAMFDIQTRLNVLRFDAGVPDGVAGRRTRTAVRQFQAANRLPVTGKLSNAGLVLLYQQSNAVLARRVPAQPHVVQGSAQPYDAAPQQGSAPQIVAPAYVAPQQTGRSQHTQVPFPVQPNSGAQTHLPAAAAVPNSNQAAAGADGLKF
ncbi:MAG: peptidoglycan-binding domain-containing protein [Pseudomonadota bacterium]